MDAIMAERILIVDDEEGMRQALKQVLTRAGYSVELAEDGASAWKALQDSQTDGCKFDLVMSDVRMPEMNGEELLRRTRELDNPPPMIIMTAFGAIEDAVGMMKAGARDYLLKPFSSETAEQAARWVLEAEHRGFAESSLEGAHEDHAYKSRDSSVSRKASLPLHLIAVDSKMKRLLAIADDVANSDATILIRGESGVGKEIIARYLHLHSARQDRPFVAINCAAVPETLLESELFGHVKGSFTGATIDRRGHFERANHGTILLDEISEMPLSLQAKLLRVLQEREIMPVGGEQPMQLDIRVLATTNRRLEESVEQGDFREDLYYRLNVITLEIPALRQRKGDILPLANYFLERHCKQNRRPLKRLGAAMEQYLLSQAWRGNVRELENFLERAVLLCKDEVIAPEKIYLGSTGVEDAPAGETAVAYASNSAASPVAESFIQGPSMTLEEMEKQLILATLEKVNGNRTRAADMLGVSVRTIRNKLTQYGLAGANA
ncbi:sigma-54-dependent Fis family transcriptional regulator [Candidatus Sumerlaeota bacterium]|nr:sigma-54-dependent Fis family transcriptional regulator [Candidatus Sumerlaeota bacterium]